MPEIDLGRVVGHNGTPALVNGYNTITIAADDGISMKQNGPSLNFSIDKSTVQEKITATQVVLRDADMDPGQQITIGTTFNIVLSKFGRMVTMHTNCQFGMAAASDFVKLGTLPEGFRPNYSVLHSYVTQNGVAMLMQIYTSGEIRLYNGNTALGEVFNLRQQISFITSS